MENNRINPQDVPGWGIDADPENDPTYPMKHWTGDDHNRINYEKAPQQALTVEILHSNERPGITRVFGTSVPPSGLSGAMRRRAFKYSEDNYAHWLTLMAADRVNVAEGFVSDIAHGHLPNILKERGWGADWKYDTKKTAIKTSVVVFSLALLLMYFRKQRQLKH
jgi:hypothetical protein